MVNLFMIMKLCLFVLFLLVFVVISELLHDVEAIFHFPQLLTASGNKKSDRE